jgi:6-phospho-beta-glucosidase
VRSPLVIYGVNESRRDLGVDEMVLYDPDKERAKLMCRLGEAAIARDGGSLRVRVVTDVREAIEGASFVLTAVRAGGMEARATDERISIRHDYPGQETTGPGGFAMALRHVGIMIEYGQMIERLSPSAWMINFTNPAGLITQAVSQHGNPRVIGICDTPVELFHRIAQVLGADSREVQCDYIGLNHLGWVRRVLLRGEDVTAGLIADEGALRRLYPDGLFDARMVRSLKLLPTEYLFFYYERRRALRNQKAVATSRGTELIDLNRKLFDRLAASFAGGGPDTALAVYIDYLNQRSGSYMQLEASAGTAFDRSKSLSEDPFRVATGYHRIALDVMNGLSCEQPRRVVINVPNQGAVADIADEDVVEVPCVLARGSFERERVGTLPDEVRGLVLAMKAYERAAIEAAVSGSLEAARRALLLCPAVGEWGPSEELLAEFARENRTFAALRGVAAEETI